MGSSQSKSNGSNRSSPNQEKHNSADSKAPLAEHAAKFSYPPRISDDRHQSTGNEVTSSPQAQTSSAKDTIYRTSVSSLHTSRTIAVDIDTLEGHSNVSRPPPPPRIRHLSELIDPSELHIDSHIRSPSGHILAPEQFLVHPDRPKSIRERQEEIREKVRAASRLGVEVEGGEGEMASKEGISTSGGKDKKTKEKKKRRCCFGGCFGRSDTD